MLQYLHLKNVGLAPDVRVDWAERINLIAGDNGLGKIFLLDLAWWALTRTWAGAAALPAPSTRKATIEYVVKGAARTTEPVLSTFRRADESWPLEAKRPPMPGIVVYIRIDGGFSVWDPARNYWRTDPDRPAAYHFQAAEVWDGLDLQGKRVCEGLERDWVNWQDGRKPQFKVLEDVLRVLSPPTEPLRVGQPQRLYVGEGRDRPTLLVGNQTVPVALASAGVRRILALAYFLVWAWHEHRVAAQLLGKKPEDRFVVLFDEPETHLHPRWQRSVLPSMLKAFDVLRGPGGRAPQMLVATHSPLVAASLEPYFDVTKDDLIHLALRDGQVAIDQGGWAKQGDATNWLVSETFGLEQARSVEAEAAIEAAEAFMRGGTVDHYLSFRSRPDLAYEWGNYRYASGPLNASKQNADATVLDPYEVRDGWFEILLPSLQMRVTDVVPAALRAKAEFTLQRLKLRDGERIIRWRQSWYRMYREGKLTLDGLREVAPLIAAAVEAQTLRQTNPP